MKMRVLYLPISPSMTYCDTAAGTTIKLLHLHIISAHITICLLLVLYILLQVNLPPQFCVTDFAPAM